MAPRGIVTAEGTLTEAAVTALHLITGVQRPLLLNARIRHSRNNWLRAPWYRYHRGGAITLGRTIYFTAIYFAPEHFGNGSIGSTWAWLRLLAHEVGHLPQAERHGQEYFGKACYVAAFVGQYGWRALTLRKDVHDGAPLEIEADMGRWVLLKAVGAAPLAHPLVLALHAGDVAAVTRWCVAHKDEAALLIAQYQRTHRLQGRVSTA